MQNIIVGFQGAVLKEIPCVTPLLELFNQTLTGVRKKEDDLTLKVDEDEDINYRPSIDVSRRSAPKDNMYTDGKVTIISKMYSFVNFAFLYWFINIFYTKAMLNEKPFVVNTMKSLTISLWDMQTE